MKAITSRDNPLYKELKNLASSSQVRRKSGRTLLDGIHLCQAYWQHLGPPQLCVVSESSRTHHEVELIVEQCLAKATQIICLPDALYQALSQVEHGIGLMFIIATPNPEFPLKLNASSVVLDNLQDPGNLGSILRSAAAAGIENVFCSFGTAFAWSPKVMRAGMGAHFALDLFEGMDVDSALASLETPVVCTSSHQGGLLQLQPLPWPCAWAFGHEGQGLSDELLRRCCVTVRIGQPGGEESLNVAAAAAICLHASALSQVGSGAHGR